MKKIFKIFLVCMMILTVTACSGGSESSDTATKIKWNKENKFADLISFKIEAIDQTKMITPDVIGTLYTYFEPADSKNVLLDLTMWVTNITNSNLKLNDEIEAIFTIDNTEYVASLLASKDNGGSLTSDVSLEANTANKVHYYVEVDPEKLDQKIEFSLNTKVEEDSDENKKSATLDFELKDAKENYEAKNLNDVITFDGYSEMTLQAANIAKEVAPASPVGLYTYYKVNDENNSFVDFTTIVKNISGSDIMASNIATVNLLDVNNNPYPATVVYEKDDHSNLEAASSLTLKNDQSAIIHYIFEVGDDVVNEAKSIRISRQGKVYIINI